MPQSLAGTGHAFSRSSARTPEVREGVLALTPSELPDS